MRIHAIQHVPFEGPALIGDWALERGHEMTTSLAVTEEFPSPREIDWLVVMGGPMAADDEVANPWLVAEKAHVAEAIDNGLLVLGVCLGAQIVAEVLGGEITRNPEREIGWWPVELTDTGRASQVFSRLPEQFVPCHWHGDTFMLPRGVRSAMHSAACENQAFEADGHVWGLQFHLEWDGPALARIAEECKKELTAAEYVQPLEQLLGETEHSAANRRLLWTLLDAMAETCSVAY